jgi:tyrosyl-tRNA synthetase
VPSQDSDRAAATLTDLVERGLLQDATDLEALGARLADGPTPTYCGFDPTADSLHLGNLQSILLLRRFQDAGHPPIALVGGATGMIGDPSGRSEERQFLDAEVLDANRASLGAQLEQFLDLGVGGSGTLVDNRTWTERVSVLEFLRNVGKHVTVNTMLAKDSVKGRISRESGISFTEFSYMLLQANDFLELHLRHGCDLQVAGSDQWGNITAGIDLVRRRTGDHVHGLTAPLVVRADGTKFGKSEGQNIWLAATRTSPFAMYQHLLNVGDEDVESLLLRLTLLPVDECRSIAAAHQLDPGSRTGQRRLAREVTTLVHGPGPVAAAEAAGAVLFAGAPVLDLDPTGLELLATELPSSSHPRSEVVGADVLELLAASELAKSKGEVRRNLAGYSVNGRPLTAREPVLDEADLLAGAFVLLARGRKSHHVLRVVG